MAVAAPVETVIKAITKQTLILLNPTKPEDEQIIHVDAGELELERVSNPFKHSDPWLVLKGTPIGQAETAWATLDQWPPVPDGQRPALRTQGLG